MLGQGIWNQENYLKYVISATTGSDPAPIPMEISIAMQSLQDMKNFQRWNVL